MSDSSKGFLLIIVDDTRNKREIAFQWFTGFEGIEGENVVMVESDWKDKIMEACATAKERGLVPLFLLDQDLGDELSGTDLCQSVLEQNVPALILSGSSGIKEQQKEWKENISEETIQKSRSMIVWEYDKSYGWSDAGYISENILKPALEKLKERENREGSRNEYKNR